jgi:hypothetical protein
MKPLALLVLCVSCAGAGQTKTDVIDCTGPAVIDAIHDVICGIRPAPAEIAERVAVCIAEEQLRHLFGSEFCAVRDGGK